MNIYTERYPKFRECRLGDKAEIYVIVNKKLSWC